MKNGNTRLLILIVVAAIFMLSSSNQDEGGSPLVTQTIRPSFYPGGGGGGGAVEAIVSPALAPTEGPVPASFAVTDLEGKTVSNVDWGLLYPGDVVSVPLLFVATNGVYRGFSVAATNFDPVDAEDFLKLSYTSGAMKLEVSSDAKAYSFSFDIIVTGEIES